MNLKRQSGILLHPTSLPETPGIGTIGKQAYKFVDWLVSAKQSIWQILPYGPTGYGDSPYASFSTFAGNPLLIDIDLLVESNWLTQEQANPPEWIKSEGYVDFGSVVWWKIPLLKLAAKQFLESAQNEEKAQYQVFIEKEKYWLDNYALFMSIKEFYDQKAKEEDRFGAMWSNYWPKKLALHEESAIEEWKSTHQIEIDIHKAIQFFFFTQWKNLKKYANEKGVQIVGDIPIFVAADSADVWANQHLFQLDKKGQAKAVAGVPPDYFSATGQLWGNPLYNWKAMAKENYAWWIARIKAMLSQVDYVRIDHFRGFEAYWSVPAGEETAVNGNWVPGPDHKLFQAIKKELGDIPIIAEDLGVITDGVAKLRDDFALPGMKVLQFAFDVNEAGAGGCINAFLPHMYNPNCVVYTGTHDNDTMQGWLNKASEQELEIIRKYITGGIPGSDLPNEKLCPELIKLALASVAKMAVIPMQDIFSLGDEGRMNTPSTTGGHNWQWRMTPEMFSPEKAIWLKEMSVLYGRNQ